MKHGHCVSEFETAFASRVGARFAIAMTNGTVTMEVALRAMGIQSHHRIDVPPLTMASTTIAVLNVGASPRFIDVEPDTWLMKNGPSENIRMPVSLYGLHAPHSGDWCVDDAAQTLRRHDPRTGFTSYSTQQSKVISTGEGGVLVTNYEELAVAAREIASLGYRLGSAQSRIDSHAIRSPSFDRHHRYPSLNARMNDVTAAEGLRQLARADELLDERRQAATLYRNAVVHADFLTPQHVPEGWTHDYWTFAVACDTPQRALRLADAIVKHGGERPYPCWRITYAEPAFKHLDPGVMAYGRRESPCPVAEDLQPRLLQLQTNSLSSAERNASALRKAIEEVG